MNDEIMIREYNSEDELDWLDLHASVMVDSYAWWTAIHRKPAYRNDIIDLVASHNEKLIGFTVGEINSDKAENKNVFIWDFGVHRNYRGKDIGRMMISHLHKIMKNKYGINKSIWYSQDPSSIRYYEHIGMKEIGRHWQLTLKPTKEQKEFFRKDKFNCWTIRGDCAIENIDYVRKKFNVIEDDDTLKPMICVGFEYVL